MKKSLLMTCVLCACVLVCGCENSLTAEKLFWKAKKTAKEVVKDKTKDELDTEDYDKIIASYNQVTEKVPLSSVAAQSHFAIAQLYASQGEYSQAQKELRKVTQNFSSNSSFSSRAQFTIGNLYEYQGDWENALLEYEKVINLYPVSDLGLKTPLYIAQHYQRDKDFVRAQKAYAKAIRNYEKMLSEFYGTSVVPVIMDHIALAYLSQGKWNETLDIWSDIASEHSQSPLAEKALLATAEVYSRQIKDLEKAIQAYEDFIKQYPDSKITKQINFQIGNLSFKKGDIEKAETVFFQLIKDYPDEKTLCANARVFLAKCYEKKGKNEQAIAQYSKIKTDYPDIMRALSVPFFIAQNYLVNQKDNVKAEAAFGQAITEYDNIIEKETDVRRVLEAGRLLSLCYLMRQEWNQAVNALHKIVDKYPDNAAAQVFLLDIAGIYQKKLDRPEEAKKIYEEVISKYPSGNIIINIAKSQLELLQHTENPGQN
ncbi:tetratricopeptide repeat protein [Candidatus Omnitrophota bacterium]